jgi:hypothetical protein
MKGLVYGPVLALVSVLFFSSSTAFADAAIIIDFDGCTLLDGDGGVVAVTTAEGVSINTQSSRSNANYICTAEVAPPSNGHAAVFNIDNTGYGCGVVTNIDENGVRETVNTNDWHEVVSANGKAKIVCNYHE